MKIDHTTKAKAGRPSLPTLTAVKGDHHSAVNLSQSLARKHNIKAGAKVDLYTDDKDNMYICFDACEGANIKEKKNGCGKYKTTSYTFSSGNICKTLLDRANESKKAVFLVSMKSALIDNKTYYLIIDKSIML